MSDFVFNGTFNVVEFDTTSTALFVDDGTRKQIEAARRNKEDTLDIDDIYGIEFFLVLSKISTIHKSTPETRLKYRQHNVEIDKEKAQLGPWEQRDD